MNTGENTKKLLLISHRGNLNGLKPEKENTQSYIDTALELGYDVEIDLWMIDNTLFLGHDLPQYKVDLEYLLERKTGLWIHTKDFNSLSHLMSYDLRIFYHEKEKHSIINNSNLIWSHDLKESNKKSIIPLLGMHDVDQNLKFDVYGICSDYVEYIKYKKLEIIL